VIPRFYKGKVACVIEVMYREKARQRNCQVRFLEGGNGFKKGEQVVTPVRLLWRRPRKKGEDR